MIFKIAYLSKIAANQSNKAMKLKTLTLTSKKLMAKYKSVMLVDDNQIDNYINEMIIKGSGFAENVFVFSGSISMLDFFKNLKSIKPLSDDMLPAYIFMDINMPILDGFQLLDEFEEFGLFPSDDIKIVVLTTSKNPIDLKKAKQYNKIVKYLVKPLSEEDLNGLD